MLFLWHDHMGGHLLQARSLHTTMCRRTCMTHLAEPSDEQRDWQRIDRPQLHRDSRSKPPRPSERDQEWLRYWLTRAKQADVQPSSWMERVKREAGYCRVQWCWARRVEARSRCGAHLRRNVNEMQRYRHQ